MPRKAKPRVTVIKKAGKEFLYMRYRNSATGEEMARSTGTRNRREAERAAALWEEELRSQIDRPDGSLSWGEFRVRYLRQALSGLAESTESKASTVLDSISDRMKPGTLAGITPPKVSAWLAELRHEGAAETTLAGYRAHLHAALRWARDMGWIHEVPKFPAVQRAKTGARARVMKGRPLSDLEFLRLLRAVPRIVGRERAGAWWFYLRGLWRSGLRLEESLKLSWDDHSTMRVDLTPGQHAVFRIPDESEKGHRDRILPMAPEFVELLQTVPREERTGLVFKLARAKNRGQSPRKWFVSRTVCDFGRSANVVVAVTRKRRSGKSGEQHTKYAGAHDLRRSFGTRWAKRVLPQVLQQLMRHENIETTLRYYVELDAQNTAGTLWEAHRRAQETKNVVSGDPTGDPLS